MLEFDSPAILLLTYTPRNDVDLKDYEVWLKKVDNPFFNNVIGIYHYSNWKVISSENKLSFTYFDFMCFNSISDFDKVWLNKEVVKFTAKWRELWGMAPESLDLSLNAKPYLFKRITNDKQVMAKKVSIEFSTSKPSHWKKSESWALVKALRDKPTFSTLRIKFLKANSHDSYTTVGSLIAGPKIN